MIINKPLPTKYSIFFSSVFVIAAIAFAIFLVKRKYEINSDLTFLISKPANGRLTKVEDLGRGFVGFKINNSNKFYDVNGYTFFNENNIKVGDSISKAENDNKIFFYKKKGENYTLCCTFNVTI